MTAPGGTGNGDTATLEALQQVHGDVYDIGIVDRAGPVPLWVAIRLEGKSDPLTGLTADALAAAIRDDERLRDAVEIPAGEVPEDEAWWCE